MASLTYDEEQRIRRHIPMYLQGSGGVHSNEIMRVFHHHYPDLTQSELLRILGSLIRSKKIKLTNDGYVVC